MTDERKLPVRIRAQRPVAVPELPSRTPGLFGTWRLKRDTAFVTQHTRQLEARTAQAYAFGSLIGARIELAKRLTAFAALDDICQSEYERGRDERALEGLERERRLAEAQRAAEEASDRLAIAREHRRHGVELWQERAAGAIDSAATERVEKSVFRAENEAAAAARQAALAEATEAAESTPYDAVIDSLGAVIDAKEAAGQEATSEKLQLEDLLAWRDAWRTEHG